MKIIGYIAGATLFFAILLALDARADFYKYTDEKGTIHITNNLQNVPEKFQKKMVVSKESPREEIKPEEAVTAKEEPLPTAPVEVKPEVEKEGLLSGLLEGPVFKYGGIALGVIAGVVALNFFLGRLSGNKKAYRLILMLVAGVVLVFLYRQLAFEMNRQYSEIKSRVTEAQKKLEERQRQSEEELQRLSNGLP
ncbi:MAG: DUF4124 domain-containing protein [Deltaproteobacteria bacterium]|nr:DUF4124 domain-containing protein [Deltaproteobacteria bacterium]